MSPSGNGRVGVYGLSCAKTLKADRRMQKTALRLIIRSPSADPVAHQLDLRVVQKRAALRHPIACDSGARNLAVQIRIRRIARRNPRKARRLDARYADRHRIRPSGGEEETP